MSVGARRNKRKLGLATQPLVTSSTRVRPRQNEPWPGPPTTSSWLALHTEAHGSVGRAEQECWHTRIFFMNRISTCTPARQSAAHLEHASRPPAAACAGQRSVPETASPPSRAGGCKYLLREYCLSVRGGGKWAAALRYSGAIIKDFPGRFGIFGDALHEMLVPVPQRQDGRHANQDERST